MGASAVGETVPQVDTALPRHVCESDLFRCLTEVGLESAARLLASEEMCIQDVLDCTDEQLRVIGLKTLGARMQVRRAASKWSQNNTAASNLQSPLVSPRAA